MAAKSRWFQTLSIEERLEFMCELVDMALEVRPKLAEPGVSFEISWPRRADMSYRKQTIHVLSRQDLIASKKATGRSVDLQDVEQLERGSDVSD